jgi:FkbM family methyltransferase
VLSELQLSSWQRFLHRFSYRLIRSSQVPKGAVAPFLRHLGMRGFYPRNVVDVGANRGRWSEKAMTVFPQARYVLLEPQIEMKSHLDRFCARYPGRVRWIHAGAGAANGSLPFTLTGSTSSTFTYSPEQAQDLGLTQRVVPVLTLDHVCAEYVGDIPELVKIDAEGFEFEILKGASSLLGKVEVFLLELPFMQPRPGALLFRDAIVQMAAYGYDVYDFTTFQQRPYDAAIGQAEVVFARSDGLLRGYKGWR